MAYPKKLTVVRVLLIANIAVFVLINIFYESIAGPYGLATAFDTLGLVPRNFWSGSLWQPLTSMFIHGSIIHLLFNMVALYSLGALLEMTMGKKHFIRLYFVSGLLGSTLVFLFQANSYSPTIGASGAISGLLGALAVRNPDTSLLLFFIPVKARTAAIGGGLLSLLLAIFSSNSQISHLGHLGGLIGGVIYTFALTKSGRHRPIEPEIDHDYQRESFFRRKPSGTIKPQEKVLVYDPVSGKYYYELK